MDVDKFMMFLIMFDMCNTNTSDSVDDSSKVTVAPKKKQTHIKNNFEKPHLSLRQQQPKMKTFKRKL